MKKLILITSIIVSLSGCSVNKDWVATGGSRADATIKLSYDFTSMEAVHVSEQQAMGLAKKRCSVWGYTGAEAFGGATTTCNKAGAWGSCEAGMITKEYQCIGQGNATPNSAVVKEPVSYYQQPMPVAEPVVENTAPSYPVYQQSQSVKSGTDVRDCLKLVSNDAIAKCVRGK